MQQAERLEAVRVEIGGIRAPEASARQRGERRAIAEASRERRPGREQVAADGIAAETLERALLDVAIDRVEDLEREDRVVRIREQPAERAQRSPPLARTPCEWNRHRVVVVHESSPPGVMRRR